MAFAIYYVTSCVQFLLRFHYGLICFRPIHRQNNAKVRLADWFVIVGNTNTPNGAEWKNKLGRISQSNSQWCKPSLSIGGIICNFTPILPYFQHWGGINLDQDFFQVSKLSEDQKKGLHLKWNTFIPEFRWRPKKKVFATNANSGEDQKKKRSSLEMEHFF